MLTNADKSMIAAIHAMTAQIQDNKTRSALEGALRGESPKPKAEDTIRQEILSGRDAAKMLACTKRTVQMMAKRGAIQRVVFPGNRRGFGYTRASIEALVGGVA